MSGNVWEWTSSWYNENKDAKVLRGGGWLSDVFIARCAYRDFYAPAFHDFDCGFRCARTQT
jgi:formylglycine-generating enzyme required for sulfatase activity